MPAVLIRKERPDGSPLEVRELFEASIRELESRRPSRRSQRRTSKVRDEPESGHIAGMAKSTRMTRKRHHGQLAAFWLCVAGPLT